MSGAPGKGQEVARKARGGMLKFIFYAGEACYFWLRICFSSLKEIQRESLGGEKKNNRLYAGPAVSQLGRRCEETCVVRS